MKIDIRNRKNQKIVVLLEDAANARGLAFIIHGLSGKKEEPHIALFAEAFKEKEYTVVRFDTTNTFGESDGKYEDATVTNYIEDLEDVIKWAKSQLWYQEPYVLVGHSLGGIAALYFAKNYSNEVKGLAPISTVVSGELSMDTPKYKESDWEQSGWKIEKSSTSPTGIKKLPWSHMIDRKKYDILPIADKLTMPILLIVGDKDDSTPPEHQRMLFDVLPGDKELHIIKDAPHSFVEQPHLEEIKQIFFAWIDKLQ